VHGRYALIPRNSGTSVTPQYLIPSLQIQARQGEPASADTAVRTVISVYRKHLDALQSAQHIARASQMSVDLLVPPSAAEVTGAKSRALAGVGLSGAAGGVLAALWTDRIVARRRRGDTPGRPWRTRTAAGVRAVH
jgi:hypothetical protein